MSLKIRIQNLGAGPFHLEMQTGYIYVMAGSNVWCECATTEEAEIIVDALNFIRETETPEEVEELKENHEELRRGYDLLDETLHSVTKIINEAVDELEKE